MSNHRDPDWLNCADENRRANAFATARELQRQQKQKASIKKWINEKLEEMDFDQLNLMYDVSYDVEKFKTFFEVLRNLK